MELSQALVGGWVKLKEEDNQLSFCIVQVSRYLDIPKYILSLYLAGTKVSSMYCMYVST